MGYLKIQENLKALRAKVDVQKTFEKSAREINEAIAKELNALPDEDKRFAKIRDQVQAMDTCGVKEFEDYKKSLLGIVAGGGTRRPLPMDPLDKVVEKARTERQSKPGETSAEGQAYDRFYKAAQDINKAVAKTAQAFAAVGEAKEKIRQRIEGLNTFGIKEFEDYKKSLLGIVAGGTPRPLPMDPVNKAIARVESEHVRMVREYYEKLAAGCPNDVKPGMVFKRPGDDTFVEITKGPFKPQNTDLKGDHAICFNGRIWKDEKAGAEISYDLADLKQMKYLKT